MNHTPTSTGLRTAGLDRRAAIGLGATLGLGAAGAAALLAGCGTGDEAPVTGTPGRSPQPFTKDELQQKIKGRVYVPADAGYAEETSVFNLTLAPKPGVVVAPADAADVQAAVAFAAARQLPVAVLATGHQHSVPVDGTAMLISTRALRGVTVDAARRTVRVEAGVQWQAVVDEAAKAGLAPLAGSSPTVGVVGYTLGGGLSPMLGRAFGFAADHVTSFDLVTADGALTKVSAASDADLFFGVLGGKSNFGIVTAIEFGLFPIRTLYAGGLFFAGDKATEVLTAYRGWTATVPDSMSSSVALFRVPDLPAAPAPLRGRLVTHVRVSYAGSAASGTGLLRPLRAAAPLIVDTVQEIPYAAFASIHQDPTTPVPAYERTALLKELTPEAIDQIVAVAGPAAPYPLLMTEIRQLGGALSRPPAAANAISARGAAFTVFTASIGGPQDADAIRRAQDDLVRRLEPWSTGHTFVNFMSMDEAAPDRARAGYTPADHNRLARLKRRVDPGNMFRFNHNIVPAA